ncbi:MAG: peptidoglycan editing factor PgeF [Pseudomonadota bacterium]|nr:peptidoglycan editing factor PgeF [Pseudomonadota bacterium]
MNKNVKFKIYDKTSPGTTGVYGLDHSSDSVTRQIIQSNYNTIINDMNAENLLILNHVHGSRVVDADAIDDFSLEPDADAVVTTKQKIALSVQSADCVPVLLASDDGKVIGGAHCGWRCAQDNVLAHVIAMMQTKGATTIKAIIGPAIHQESYEVGHGFYTDMLAAESASVHLFKRTALAEKWLFDLPGFITLKLKILGVTDILDLCENTFTNPHKYYSYRYEMQRGITGNNNNILSAIMIEQT